MGLIENETGTQRLLGYVLDVSGPDQRARCSLRVTADHTNRHGVLHGGIAATVLDNAMGATASLTRDPKGRKPFLTISLNISFVSPAREEQTITAIGRVTGGGRSLLFITGELTDGDGRLIAQATGVFKPAGRNRTAPEAARERQ